MSEQKQSPKIVVAKNGPYLVHGNPAVVRKKQITSEHGEPMTWQTNETIDTGDRPVVALCRCGGSANKPFCDGIHAKNGFDGTETAATDTFEERKIVHEGSTGIVIKRDYSICAESGFCGHRLANIQKLAPQTDDSIVRAQVMAMIERCPSGSYTYALDEDMTDIEPDLPQQVAVTTEMTSEGPTEEKNAMTNKLKLVVWRDTPQLNRSTGEGTLFEPPFDYLVSIPYYSFEPRISPSDPVLPNARLSSGGLAGRAVARRVEGAKRPFV